MVQGGSALRGILLQPFVSPGHRVGIPMLFRKLADHEAIIVVQVPLEVVVNFFWAVLEASEPNRILSPMTIQFFKAVPERLIVFRSGFVPEIVTNNIDGHVWPFPIGKGLDASGVTTHE